MQQQLSNLSVGERIRLKDQDGITLYLTRLPRGWFEFETKYKLEIHGEKAIVSSLSVVFQKMPVEDGSSMAISVTVGKSEFKRTYLYVRQFVETYNELHPMSIRKSFLASKVFKKLRTSLKTHPLSTMVAYPASTVAVTALFMKLPAFRRMWGRIMMSVRNRVSHNPALALLLMPEDQKMEMFAPGGQMNSDAFAKLAQNLRLSDTLTRFLTQIIADTLTIQRVHDVSEESLDPRNEHRNYVLSMALALKRRDRDFKQETGRYSHDDKRKIKIMNCGMHLSKYYLTLAVECLFQIQDLYDTFVSNLTQHMVRIMSEAWRESGQTRNRFFELINERMSQDLHCRLREGADGFVWALEGGIHANRESIVRTLLDALMTSDPKWSNIVPSASHCDVISVEGVIMDLFENVGNIDVRRLLAYDRAGPASGSADRHGSSVLPLLGAAAPHVARLME